MRVKTLLHKQCSAIVIMYSKGPDHIDKGCAGSGPCPTLRKPLQGINPSPKIEAQMM